VGPPRRGGRWARGGWRKNHQTWFRYAENEIRPGPSLKALLRISEGAARPTSTSSALARHLLTADGVAVDRAEKAAAAFEEANQCGPRPDDLRFDREAADLRMVERDDRSLVRDRVVV